LVAGFASGHDVFPTFTSALDNGHHVIEGEMSFAELPAAVLADIVVPEEDIASRKSNDVFLP
jgi:hypothetical protein